MHDLIEKYILILTQIFVGLILSFSSFSQAKTEVEYILILKKFEQWKVVQYKKGIFATELNCDLGIVTKSGYKGPERGIPKDINIYYTDLNLDDKIDAVITFQPSQCDGGVALKNAQMRLLILSKKEGYIVDDTFLDKMVNAYKTGWFIVDGALYGTIYGTYYQYKNRGAKGHALISNPFSINYKTNEISITDR
jgi:hypothetical protein